MSRSVKLPAARAVVTLLGVTTLGVTGLSACTTEVGEPEDEHYVIGIAPDSTEQAVLGEIYRVVLESVGQATEVRETPAAAEDSAVEVVRSGAADMAIGCTGTLLGQIDPQQAEQAREELGDESGESDKNDVSAAEDIYEYTVAGFPGGVMTIDPSPAEGCAAAGEQPGEGDLPNSIIPVFEKLELNRGQVYRLNYVTRLLRTEEVSDMVSDVDNGRDVGEVVTEWMLQRTKITIDPQSEEEGETGRTDNVIDQPPV